MARPVRTVRDMPQYIPVEQLGGGVDGEQSQAAWVPAAWPPAGMDLTLSANNVQQGKPEVVVNLVPYHDHWQLRYGTDWVGTTPVVARATTELIYAKQFVLANGIEYILRWSTTGIEQTQGGPWVAMTGPALTLSMFSKITVTGWNNLVIFSDGESGMYAADPTAGTYSLIADAPAATHLTTFNRRVVASVENRVQWCVAGDYTDWTSTDLGAGFEDLLSAPDGSVDRQTAVLPVSDEVAYMVRSNSIWQMEPTRSVDAPFAFSRVIGNLGSRWPQACCAVPGGIAFLADQQVYLLQGELQNLTPPIRDLLRTATQADLRACVMIYDRVEECLRLLTPLADVRTSNVSTTHSVLRWHFRIGGGWTIDQYANMRPVSIASAVDFRDRLTIGELTGTVGALVGVIGDLGVAKEMSGFLLVTQSVSTDNLSFPYNGVVREDALHNTDASYTQATLTVSTFPVTVLVRAPVAPGPDASRACLVSVVDITWSNPTYASTGAWNIAALSFRSPGYEIPGAFALYSNQDTRSARQETIRFAVAQSVYAPIVEFFITGWGLTTNTFWLHDLRARVTAGAPATRPGV